jgi:hypothetical protein
MKMASKGKQKKTKRRATKNSSKPKASAKKKSKAKPKRKAARRASRRTGTPMGSQSVETVSLRPRARTARAGAGGGDFGGVSVVESADSESADELLEEGQAFEAGIVSGVENAPNADQEEVRTHEVSQDDVPAEYEDKDRP